MKYINTDQNEVAGDRSVRVKERGIASMRGAIDDHSSEITLQTRWQNVGTCSVLCEPTDSQAGEL